MGLASLFQDSDGMISKSIKLNGKVAFSRDGVPSYPALPRERLHDTRGAKVTYDPQKKHYAYLQSTTTLYFFYTIFLPDGQNITFVWDSMFEDICAAEFVFL